MISGADVLVGAVVGQLKNREWIHGSNLRKADPAAIRYSQEVVEVVSGFLDAPGFGVPAVAQLPVPKKNPERARFQNLRTG